MAELRRVIIICLGIAAVLLGLLSLIDHSSPNLTYWLAGGIIASGSAVTLGFL